MNINIDAINNNLKLIKNEDFKHLGLLKLEYPSSLIFGSENKAKRKTICNEQLALLATIKKSLSDYFIENQKCENTAEQNKKQRQLKVPDVSTKANKEITSQARGEGILKRIQLYTKSTQSTNSKIEKEKIKTNIQFQEKFEPSAMPLLQALSRLDSWWASKDENFEEIIMDPNTLSAQEAIMEDLDNYNKQLCSVKLSNRIVYCDERVKQYHQKITDCDNKLDSSSVRLYFRSKYFYESELIALLYNQQFGSVMESQDASQKEAFTQRVPYVYAYVILVGIAIEILVATVFFADLLLNFEDPDSLNLSVLGSLMCVKMVIFLRDFGQNGLRFYNQFIDFLKTAKGEWNRGLCVSLVILFLTFGSLVAMYGKLLMEADSVGMNLMLGIPLIQANYLLSGIIGAKLDLHSNLN